MIADLVHGQLPGGITEANGRPEAAPANVPRQPEIKTPAQVVAEICQEVSDGFLKDPDKLDRAVKRVLELWALRDLVDMRALPVALPFNSGQVRAGGFALLNVCTTMEDARPLNVDCPALARNLAQVERVRRFRAVIDPIAQVLAASESQGLKSVATQVQQGLGLGMSLIRGNGALQRALEPALAIKGDPIETGLQTRAQNVRTDAAIRADEQAKLLAQGGGDPHKGGTTTTVTTEVPAGAPVPAPTPRTPPAGGTHRTKKVP